ncbi:MAG TPA: carboxylating nicotinate-nucleotide diphosphorylase [Bacteroidales bacterium]|nr:carboxylating nicotinate-nucleotide diphosphorylase [Bacteroidales bacterium]
MENSELQDFIRLCLQEDIGTGDHSSLSCIPSGSEGTARLLVKQKGVLAGVRVAGAVFSLTDPGHRMNILISDGSRVSPGDVAFFVTGSIHAILKSERLVLNIMQRMSGIATSTSEYVARLEGLRTRILDTRKTAPGMRMLEKEAVRLGGGNNHRMGLYDMIMLKDNHVDYAGGIARSIEKACNYITRNGLDLRIEIEARNLEDVREIISAGKVDRIMLDNFSLPDTREAVKLIDGRFETESSGGITLENVRDYALCGVDYVSVGAITHHLRSLDLSLKAVKESS